MLAVLVVFRHRRLSHVGGHGLTQVEQRSLANAMFEYLELDGLVGLAHRSHEPMEPGSQP